MNWYDNFRVLFVGVPVLAGAQAYDLLTVPPALLGVLGVAWFAATVLALRWRVAAVKRAQIEPWQCGGGA